jgi:putative glycosyltransferase (TIGR04372 family)
MRLIILLLKKNNTIYRILKKLYFNLILIKNKLFFFLNINKNFLSRNYNFLYNFFYIINIYKILTDPSYAEKMIAKSYFLNHIHLICMLKISTSIQKKRIKKLEHKNINDINLCKEYSLQGRNYWYQGNTEKAINCFSKEEFLRDKLSRIKYGENTDTIYLPRNTIHVLGLIGHLDGVIKFYILKKKNIKFKIIGDKKTIINKYFFNLFKDYIEFVDINNLDNTILDEELYKSKNLHWVMPDNSNYYQIAHKTFSNSLKRWGANKYEPIIKVPNNDNKKIFEFKKYYNIPFDKKIICIHIRGNDLLQNHNIKADKFRTSSINDYIETINFINSKGIYVVRIGDKFVNFNTNSLNNKDMFIDYPKGNLKSDMMDIILINNSELFIGTNSGPHWVASSLGKKLCLINIPFNDGFPYYNNVIFLPLIYKMHNKTLHFKDILKSFTGCTFDWLFEMYKIKIYTNSSKDILDTVKESMYESNLINNYEYKNLNKVIKTRNFFNDLNHKFNRKIYAKLSATYIENNF